MIEDETAEDRPSEFVEALAKGLAILESFDARHPEMTLSDLARRVGISPAAARRSLITLQTLGYVGQTGRRFHLRPKVMGLGSALYFSAGVDRILQPYLKRLVELFGDASSVGILQGDDVLYIAHYSQQRARRPTAIVGARYPAHATSLGRVLLAALPEEHFDHYLDHLDPVARTHKTVIDKKELRQTIAKVRKDGYSTTVNQLDYGITAIAVPIHGTASLPIAALNSSGFTGLVTPEDLIANRLRELRGSARRIAETVAQSPLLESMLGARHSGKRRPRPSGP